MSIQTNLSNEQNTFLSDSQADISVIKRSAFTKPFSYNPNEIITVKGVTKDSIESLGTAIISMIIDNIRIEHKFHIFDDTLNIPTDGIIGKDFLKTHHCCIDYGIMALVIRTPYGESKLKIRTEFENGDIYIPPRAEIFKLFHIKSATFPVVIKNQEIAPNVIIPTTIAYEPQTWIRVLNVSENPCTTNSNNIQYENLTQYDIYKVSKSQGTNVSEERKAKLRKNLRDKIPKHVRETLLKLCEDYADIFHLDGDKPTTNNFYSQNLNLSDSTPVFVKNYRLPQSQKEEIRAQVTKLLENDLIEHSQSPYNSPLLLVPKKSLDGTPKWRLCVDFRMLNRKLIPDKHPLPRMDDILDGLGRARYFSVIDLHSGFHQIPLEHESRPLTAFSTDFGMFQWTVLPFGINVAPSSFTRMMTLAFSGLEPNQAFIYMDDIIIIGFSEQNHLKNIHDIFETCRKFNLRINPLKCDFFKHEVDFLGHKCTANGLLPDQSKIHSIVNYPKPKDKAEAKRFVAMANYYRRFIKNFATLTKPLSELTRKRIEFKWSEQCEIAFQKLKNQISSPPILQYPKFEDNNEFILTVDASEIGCGGVLSQKSDDLPITFISRTFKQGEKNKPIIEKELLAVHFAITQLRPYLYGRKFTVRSDHKPLIYLYSLKNPSSKLTRIRLDLEEYNFVIEHIAGKNNVVADALSRVSIDDIKQVTEYEKHNIFTVNQSVSTALNQISIHEIKSIAKYNESNIYATTRSMSREQNRRNQNELPNENELIELPQPKAISELIGFDKKVPRIKISELLVHKNTGVIAQLKFNLYKNRKIIAKIEMQESVNDKLSLHTILSKLQCAADKINLNKIQWPLNDLIFKLCTEEEFKIACNKILKNLTISLIKPAIIINNEQEKGELLRKYHNDALYGGHAGRNRLYAQLKSKYYWKNMTKYVAEFIKNCKDCQLNKPRVKNQEELLITQTPQAPFDKVVIDTIGPFERSKNNNKYAVTMICDLTKYLVTAPIIDKSAKQVAKAIFEHFILKFGPMKEILTDRGTEYKNELMSEICNLMKINHNTSTAYRHQTVGTIERNHRVLNEYMRSYFDNDEWEKQIQYFTFCYNISKNTCFNFKFTPYELVYGKNVNISTDTFSQIMQPVYNIENYLGELKIRLKNAITAAREYVDKLKMRNKANYDKNSSPLNVNIGEQVLLEIEPYDKHSNKYAGPYEIIAIDGHNVIISVNGKFSTIHKDRIRKLD